MTRPMSIIATKHEIVLTTVCVCPPIPFRGWDWDAYDENRFNPDYDYETGMYVCKMPRGAGATEAEAIDTLIDELEAA